MKRMFIYNLYIQIYKNTNTTLYRTCRVSVLPSLPCHHAHVNEFDCMSEAQNIGIHDAVFVSLLFFFSLSLPRSLSSWIDRVHCTRSSTNQAAISTHMKIECAPHAIVWISGLFFWLHNTQLHQLVSKIHKFSEKSTYTSSIRFTFWLRKRALSLPPFLAWLSFILSQLEKSHHKFWTCQL